MRISSVATMPSFKGSISARIAVRGVRISCETFAT